MLQKFPHPYKQMIYPVSFAEERETEGNSEGRSPTCKLPACDLIPSGGVSSGARRSSRSFGLQTKDRAIRQVNLRAHMQRPSAGEALKHLAERNVQHIGFSRCLLPLHDLCRQYGFTLNLCAWHEAVVPWRAASRRT